MSKKIILLIEDETEILLTNKEFLERRGYGVLTAETVSQAEVVLKNHTPDLILLDIELPDGNGLDFILSLRESASRDIPVIFLTARKDSADMIKGLERGGCDYITKPYEFGVLAARIESVLRSVEHLPEKITRGALLLDPISGQAFLNGGDLLLTQKEFALLLFFIQNENRFIDGEYLYEKIWKTPMEHDNQALRKTISRLRAKIKDSEWRINWSRDEGYCFMRE